jgi:hypothetical protein
MLGRFSPEHRKPIEGWKWQKNGHCGTLATLAVGGLSRYDQ